jgi:hypothetical protein
MSEQLNEFTDASGKVTVAVFRQRAGNAQSHFFDLAVDVPGDMVAIGGGAEAASFPVGALLTASYPNHDLSAWLVSSKDHLVEHRHRLTGYAIAVRIAGMSRDALLKSIRVSVQDSGVAQHPEASATLPSAFRLVSGGFKIEWTEGLSTQQLPPGNLATASFPQNTYSWTARAKDHGAVSPANLRVWAIGLRRQLPAGRVLGAIEDRGSTVAQHPEATADLPDGFALTGAGARVNWQVSPFSEGSLLWRLAPTTNTANQEVRASAKDHLQYSPATITTYALGIRIR